MRLHNDLKLLEEAIRATAAHFSLPVTYIEKDYWVTRALKALADSSISDEIVFKGGTSLSKAYKLIARFSEDIDIAILTVQLSNSQTARKVKKASKIVAAIYNEIPSDDNAKNSNFRKVRFGYPRIDSAIVEGQVSDSILLEINAFADPEPHRKMSISSYISDFLLATDQTEAIIQYELAPFDMNILCTSRTLCEKIMGLVKASHGDNYLSQLNKKIRHIYDLHFLLSDPFTKYFIGSEQFSIMIDNVINSDRNIFPNTSWLDSPLSHARIFSNFNELWPGLESTYNNEFKAMVVDNKLPSKELLNNTITIIQNKLVLIGQ